MEPARGAGKVDKASRVPGLIPLAIIASACGGEVGFWEPPPGDNDLRPGLTLHVGLAAEAASVGEVLGWGGRVPGAEVRVHRFGTVFAWETAVTNDEGVARFPRLLPGRYRIAVYRPLRNAETATSRVNALAGGLIGQVGDAGTDVTVELVVNEPGSLVISEVYAHAYLGPQLNYDFEPYMELYNNSGETVFLDGLSLGKAGLIGIATPSVSCADTRALRHDPDGIWFFWLYRFPGTGGEYPLAPWTAAVVARDAVDHSVIDPRLPDLSAADFEIIGLSDVDNPDVPNIVEISNELWWGEHGLYFAAGDTWFIANRVDPSTLPRHRTVGPPREYELFRMPSTDVIDVAWTVRDKPLDEQQYELCDGLVHPSFDRLGGGFLGIFESPTVSMHRIELPEAAPGRLQDTNVSAVDFFKAPHSPGWVR